MKYIISLVIVIAGIVANAQMASNPVIYADVPDPDIILVGDTYYMTSTTMHFNPGVPIMKSKDLVTWETIGYVYDKLTDNNNANLEAGSTMYGKGSWASCIRYANGYFYVYFHSYTTNSAHVYRTADIESGNWEAATMGGMHDLSVLFDDDGRVWSVYGGPNVQIRELTPDGMAFQPGTTNRTLIPNVGSPAGSSFIVAGEGAHIMKIDGYYYVFIITWPNGSGRTQVVWRSKSLNGPWEGKVVLRDNGVAQGQIVQTPEGKWYGLLFKDSGGVGRIPYITNVNWVDGWPMMTLPTTLDIPASKIDISGIVASDDFNYTNSSNLSTAWQWNHNPDNKNWSVTTRPGHYRITTSRTDANIYSAKNTLTQRTYGPTSVGVASMDVSNMKNGDYAGLSAFQDEYGFVGVKMSGGSKQIIMMNDGVQVASAPLSQDIVYLRANCNFRNGADDATFHYSLDGNSWTSIGNTVQMSFQLTHFCGYRFALFNYATQTPGGYVDFDYFKTGYDINGLLPFTSSVSVSLTSPAEGELHIAPATIELTAEASVSEGSISKVEFYNGTELLGEDATEPYTYSWSGVGEGSYSIKAVATDSEGNEGSSAMNINVLVPQAPYGGSAHAVPGKIELEEYDVGGNGQAYYDTDAGTKVDPAPNFRTDEDVDIEICSDTGEGYNLGWTAAGEWLEYTVNVQKTGSYDIVLRASTDGDGKTVSLSANGVTLANDVAITNTLGWQEWTDITIPDIELEAGEQVLRLTIGESDFVNLNYMTFIYNDIPVDPIPLNVGWNLIGCPLEGSTEISSALSSIWEQVTSVKDMNSFYQKGQADFLNTLRKLDWGKGYLVKVDAGCMLEW